MLIKAAAFLLGSTSLSFFKTLPPLASPLLLLLLSIFFYYHYKKTIFLFICLFLISFSWASFQANQVSNSQIKSHQEKKEIQIKGYVASLPKVIKKRPFTLQFEFKTIEFDEKKSKKKLLLSWYNAHNIQLIPGQHWVFSVKVKKPNGIFNSGGFDKEKYYFQNKISAVGYIFNKGKNKPLNQFHRSQKINQWRLILYEKAQNLISAKVPFMGVLIALSLGIRDHITAEQWLIFQKTGTQHLIAISGLHIGLIAGFFYFLGEWIWKRSYQLLHWMPAQQAGAFLGLIAAIIYSAFAGFSLPTKRALIMISIFCLAKWLRRNVSHWEVFGLALIVILILDPISVLSESFWLSFGAVFFILYSTNNRFLYGKSLWIRYFKTQWRIVLGLFPITLFLFQKTSLIAFPANLIAIPSVSFLVIPTTLLGSFFLFFSEDLGKYLLIFSEKILGWIFIFLEKISDHDYAFFDQSLSSYLLLASILLGVLIILLPKGMPGRLCGALLFIPLFFQNPKTLPEKTIGFTLLDVGQGLSAIIRTQNHVLVFDTGAKFSAHYDMGKAAVLPYLKHHQIKKIDTLIVSHQDNDHMGGAQSILKEIETDKILTSVPWHFKKQNAHFCRRGQKWKWDGVQFEMLYPTQNKKYEGNNSSCTLKVSIGNQSILLTGDLEKKGEHNLIKLEGENLKSSILVAGHHGSKSSSTLSFLKKVAPSYTLFSSGYLNQYHFPHPSVVKNFQRISAQLLNTAEMGGLYFEINESGIKTTKCYRGEQGKHWNKKVLSIY